MYLNHNFYVELLVNNVVQKMRRWVTNTIFLYKLTNVLLSFICFKLVMKLIKFVGKILVHKNEMEELDKNLIF